MDDQTSVMYSVIIPKVDGDLYFTLESYYASMIDKSCQTGGIGYPLLYYAIYQNGKEIGANYYYEDYARSFLL